MDRLRPAPVLVLADGPAIPEPGSGRQALARAVSKARLRLMPFLILMYLLAFLDRANVGAAKQALQAQAGVTEAMFALGAGIFFVGYAVFEVPSNLILYRVGARRWLARIMIGWGLVAAATMFVVGGWSFVALRLLLGMMEAGFFPGVILYLTLWFPPEYRGRVLGLFYFGYPLALVLGGPFSGALLDMDGWGGLAGWQWMFAVQGVLASLVGVLTLFVLPDRPAEVGWLDDEEKAALSAVITREASEKSASGSGSFRQALRDVRLLHFVLIYFLMQIGSYGVVFFLPDQVSRLLGMKIGLLVGLVTSIPWLCAIGFTATWPVLAQRFNRPRACFLVCLVMITLGIAVSAHAAPVAAIVSLCVAAAGIIAAQAIFWTFPTDRFGGTAAAGGIAVINAIGNLGGFVAPNLRAAADRWFPTAGGAHVAGIHAVAIASAIAVLAALLLPSRGRRVVEQALPIPEATQGAARP